MTPIFEKIDLDPDDLIPARRISVVVSRRTERHVGGLAIPPGPPATAAADLALLSETANMKVRVRWLGDTIIAVMILFPAAGRIFAFNKHNDLDAFTRQLTGLSGDVYLTLPLDGWHYRFRDLGMFDRFRGELDRYLQRNWAAY